MASLLDERTTGSSGISIGTHLALETLFSDKLDIYDNERVFEKANVDDYRFHIFNLYTLVRNLVNSCLHKQKDEILMDKKFVPTLAMEVSIISNLYDGTNCKPLLFYPDYNRVYKAYNMGKGNPETRAFKEHMVIRNVLYKHDKQIKSINDGKGYKIPKLDGLKPTDKVLITTNIACDLFNKFNLFLLESHTGKIKNKYEFNTKYHRLGSNDMSSLPYVEKLMFLLGDNYIVHPFGVKERRLTLNIASENKWTVRTTEDYVTNGLRKEMSVWKLVGNFRNCY